MRTTAILNLKGGVGKTTTAINLATILACNYRKRVLIIDADAQHNTTDFLVHTPLQHISTVTGRLKKDQSDPCTLVNVATGHGSVGYSCTVCPSNDDLMDLDLTKAGTGELDLNWISNFRFRNDGASLADAFDYCIIDCPPAFNAASASALISADDVVIPMKLDAFAISGMANLSQQISNMQRINPKLTVAGILPTMWYKAPAIIEAEKILLSSGLNVFHHIRRSPTVDSMTFSQIPLIDGSPKSGALKDYIQFTREYSLQEVK